MKMANNSGTTQAHYPDSGSPPAVITDGIVALTPVERRMSSPQMRLDQAKAAMPLLLVLVTCFAFIATSFEFLTVGVENLSALAQPHLTEASRELLAQQKLVDQELLLYNQLDKLLDSQLSWGILETYPGCLARGVAEAQKHVSVVGFAYPEVRKQATDWVMSNCKRMFYTPQLFKPTPCQILFVQLVQSAHYAKQVAHNALRFVLTRAKIAWVWYSGQNLAVAEPAWRYPVYEYEVIKPNSIQPGAMPLGIYLTYDDTIGYQLLTTNAAWATTDMTLLSAERIVKLGQEVRTWTTVSNVSIRISCWTSFIALASMFLQWLCVLAYCATGFYVADWLSSVAIERTTYHLTKWKITVLPTEIHAFTVASIVSQIISFAVRRFLSPVFGGTTRLALWFGSVSTLIIGSGMLMFLFFGLNKVFGTAFSLWEGIAQLRLVLTSKDTSPAGDIASSLDDEEEEKSDTDEQNDTTVVNSFDQATTLPDLPSSLPESQNIAREQDMDLHENVSIQNDGSRQGDTHNETSLEHIDLKVARDSDEESMSSEESAWDVI